MMQVQKKIINEVQIRLNILMLLKEINKRILNEEFWMPLNWIDIRFN